MPYRAPPYQIPLALDQAWGKASLSLLCPPLPVSLPRPRGGGWDLVGAKGPFSLGIRVFLFSCLPTSLTFPQAFLGIKITSLGITVAGRLLLSP